MGGGGDVCIFVPAVVLPHSIKHVTPIRQQIKHIRTTPTAGPATGRHNDGDDDEDDDEGDAPWQEQQQPPSPPSRSPTHHRHPRPAAAAGGVGGSKALMQPFSQASQGLLAAFASLAPSAVARSLQRRLRPGGDHDDEDGGADASQQQEQQEQQQQQHARFSARRDEAPAAYTCPKCQREFDAWVSCHAHLTARCVVLRVCFVS